MKVEIKVNDDENAGIVMFAIIGILATIYGGFSILWYIGHHLSFSMN